MKKNIPICAFDTYMLDASERTPITRSKKLRISTAIDGQDRERMEELACWGRKGSTADLNAAHFDCRLVTQMEK